ncbi:MAG TPA: M13 family peptidase, partial [Sphingomonas sp.]|nr:M13 family peptidase [Sphingomonas sp.]
MRLSCLAAAALLLGTSLPALAQTAPAPAAKPKYGSWGVDYATMDKSVKPGDDFFRFAEGSWLRDAQIAPDKSRAGYNYDLPDETEVEVRMLVEGAGAHPADPVMRQVSDFYAAWMDEAGIEARGLAPLAPYLGRIAAVKDRKAPNLLMAEPGYAAPIGIGISADEKNPTRYTVMAGQARLGLP